ncbi:MAG: hypothetical protein SO045_05620 [Campylobacter sp.]|nr:hypothetical protein [Campylobacter sp.]
MGGIKSRPLSKSYFVRGTSLGAAAPKTPLYLEFPKQRREF